MHLYNALLCMFVHQSIYNRGGGGGGGVNHGLLIITLDWLYLSLLNHHQCAASWMMRRLSQDSGARHTSYRWRGERVIEPIKCMRSPHTRYRWRGERDIEPIKCMRSPHTRYRWRGERIIESIKCMRSPHTSYRWRGERDRANQVYALTTHQLQVERRER